MGFKKRNKRDRFLSLFTGYGRLSEYNRNIFAKSKFAEVSDELSNIDSEYPSIKSIKDKNDE